MATPIDEQSLCQMIDEQTERFSRATEDLAVIETTLQKQGLTWQLQEQLHELTQALGPDPSYRPAVELWNQAALQGSPRIKQAIASARATLQTLLDRIDSVESIARGMKDGLLPRIDQGTRTRAARDAYGRASSSNRSSNTEPS